MSTELKYLAFTAMLTAALWVPYIVCQVMTNGFLAAENYVDPAARPVPLWGRRADRVYMNAVETFAPFAALVILIHIAGKENSTTALLVMSFFWLRVVHAIVYWFGIPFIRTLVFTLSFFAVLGLFFELMM
jgi:uncharacterized MAPEG superfamily protein